MLQKVICITGREAAVLFYNPEYFQRKDATPKRIQKTLFGEKGVQALDGEEHRHRKEMFMSLMTPENIGILSDIVTEEWQCRLGQWQLGREVDLSIEVQDILCAAACKWAGVPLPEADLRRRAADMHKMVAAFGAIGPRHWRGRAARRRSEKWAGRIIALIRNSDLYPHPRTAAHAIAWHRDPDGRLLDKKTAAVELINVIRPIVAVSWFIVFTAIALKEHPECRTRVNHDESYAEQFVHEVRRFYPFTPFIGARTRTGFSWNGYRFPKGRLVILDMYGMNHDPRIWDHPERFDPSRFKNRTINGYDFIPQGGGDFLKGHRCAGEWVTIEIMKIAALFLSRFMDFEIADQNLSYNLAKMPTRPQEGFVIRFG